MNQKKALREVLVFIVLTLGASFFVFWGPIAVLQIPTISFVSDIQGPGWAIALFITGGFMPSLVALFLTWKWEGADGLRRMGKRVIQFRLGWRAYLAAVTIILAVTGGQIGLMRLMGQSFDLSLFAAQLGSFIPLLIIGPLSEELGWRGYALDRLQLKWSPIVSALIVGVAWSFWHLPLFFIVGTSQHELAMPFSSFLLSVTSLAVCYSWLYNLTGRSIWSAIFLHWIQTYAAQVIASGVTRTHLYNWLEFIPAMFVALVVIGLWLRKRAEVPVMDQVSIER